MLTLGTSQLAASHLSWVVTKQSSSGQTTVLQTCGSITLALQVNYPLLSVFFVVQFPFEINVSLSMSIVGRSKSNKYTKLGKQCISFNLILKRRQLTDKVTVRANIQGVPKTACHYTNLQLPLECLGLLWQYKPGW